jgi:hypothetical protein
MEAFKIGLNLWKKKLLMIGREGCIIPYKWPKLVADYSDILKFAFFYVLPRQSGF